MFKRDEVGFAARHGSRSTLGGHFLLVMPQPGLPLFSSHFLPQAFAIWRAKAMLPRAQAIDRTGVLAQMSRAG
jgi:hypothetical protein